MKEETTLFPLRRQAAEGISRLARSETTAGGAFQNKPAQSAADALGGPVGESASLVSSHRPNHPHLRVSSSPSSDSESGWPARKSGWCLFHAVLSARSGASSSELQPFPKVEDPLLISESVRLSTSGCTCSALRGSPPTGNQSVRRIRPIK